MMSPDAERRARVALSFLANPGDPVIGATLRRMSASEVLAATTGSDVDGGALLADQPPGAALTRAIERWRARLPDMPTTSKLAAWQERGLRLIQPGDPEWPSQLDDLGDTRPLVLWARGSADLRLSCVNSVSIVGSRAATGYGNHVAIEMAALLAERGVAVVSAARSGLMPVPTAGR
jgi:DNA processing protein